MVCPECCGEQGKFVCMPAANEKGEAVLGQKRWEPCARCGEAGRITDPICRHCGTTLICEDGGENYYCPEGCLN